MEDIKIPFDCRAMKYDFDTHFGMDDICKKIYATYLFE